MSSYFFNGKALLRLIFCCIIFSSCRKNIPPIFKLGGSGETHIYVAGYESNGTNNVAKCWIDGQEIKLSNGSNNAMANFVFVSGKDVYIAGSDNGAVYWKNNVEIRLSGNDASSIFVSGNDVYVGGSDGTGVYWKNGTKITLSGVVNSIFVSGNDVYTAGYDGSNAVYWKNGTEITLMEGIFAASEFWVNSIYVMGQDVYAVGSSKEAGNAFPPLWYWKNGDGIPVHIGENYGPGNSIFVSGSDVYIAGMNESSPAPYIPTAAYWKNGNLTLLPRSEINSFANSIYVLGSDIYVAGYEEATYPVNYAVYWKNGIEVKLSDGSQPAIATSIFVR
jgi:hypothetical protein